jgi:hypothetical protein
MTLESDTGNRTPILGGFASILSLLGITLYFSGWIYRWSYFAYFSLNLNDQSFTAQSFLIVPIQIYLGTPANLLKTFLLLLGLPLLINATLALLRRLSTLVAQLPARFRTLPHLLAFPQATETRLSEARRFLASLVDELVIVAWVLILLFWFSQYQGLRDARRDAVETTSTLPSVTLVLPQREGILGQDLRVIGDSGEPIPDPPLANQALMGDAVLARELRNTSLSDPHNQQVWRLLNQETTGWLYMIRTISASSIDDERPLVVAVPNAMRGQTLIIKPPLPK